MSLQTTEPPRKPIKPPRIDGKLRQACLHLVHDGLPWKEAAIKAGFTPAAMLYALERPHVLAFIRQQREVLRTALSTRATFRMVDLSEQNDNMAAAVSATKTLMGEQDQELSGPAHRAPPGLLIQIVQAPHMTHVVADAAKPLIEHEVVPVDEHERQPGRPRE